MLTWLKQFALPGYWLWLSPGPLSRTMLIALLSKFGAFVAASFVLRFLASKKKGNIYWQKGVPRLARALLWTGLLGLLYVWFRYERVYFFSARFWLLALAAVFVVWIIGIVKYMTKVLPKEAAAFAEKARIEKYLPKGKS